MLSVIIPTLNSERDLANLLARLVPAAVDGLVRDVIVADQGSTDATLAICEDAGVDVVRRLGEAAARAKSMRVLVLPVAIRLPIAWERAVATHLGSGGGDARISGEGGRWWRPSPSGWLLTCDALSGIAEFDQVRRRVRSPARL